MIYCLLLNTYYRMLFFINRAHIGLNSVKALNISRRWMGSRHHHFEYSLPPVLFYEENAV